MKPASSVTESDRLEAAQWMLNSLDSQVKQHMMDQIVARIGAFYAARDQAPDDNIAHITEESIMIHVLAWYALHLSLQETRHEDS